MSPSHYTHSPQSDRAGADVPAIVMYTITEFCAAHKISRSKLYQLWRAGICPRSIKIGSRNLITAESACAWRRRLEDATEA
jgi:predicted DNA-binding transcriptional regulator AlpA